MNACSAGAYTFGEPMVVDARFAAMFRTKTYRFVHHCDLMTRIPSLSSCERPNPHLLEYGNVGHLEYIAADSRILDNAASWGGLMGKITTDCETLFNANGLLNDAWRTASPIETFMNHSPLLYAPKIWNNFVTNPSL
jgi:hypothetical protein